MLYLNNIFIFLKKKVVAPSPMRTYIATPVSNEANSVAGVLRARLLDVFKVLFDVFCDFTNAQLFLLLSGA